MKSDHKYIYKKIIFHYGGRNFSWGEQCTICGRIDDAYKSSHWNPKDFVCQESNWCKSLGDTCLSEIHKRYPEYNIFTLEKNARWKKWSNESR